MPSDCCLFLEHITVSLLADSLIYSWLETLMAVRPFWFPAPQSGTFSRILSGTRPSVQTVSDICIKRIYSLDTSAFSALEVPDDNFAVQIYLLTARLKMYVSVCVCVESWINENTVNLSYNRRCLRRRRLVSCRGQWTYLPMMTLLMHASLVIGYK